jgi:hypothetical protein
MQDGSLRTDSSRVGSRSLGREDAGRGTARPAYLEPEEPVHEDQHEHLHLPPSSIWPMTVAAGMTLLGFGLLTSEYVSLLGFVLTAVGVFNWVQELRHELH